MTDSRTFCRICINHNFTFINNCFKFILNRCVQNFSDMFQTETCIKCILTDTDTLHISLSGVVYTLDTVDIVVEFTLDNRFKVRLHCFSCNFYYVCDAVFTSQFHLIHIWSYDGDLMIFYFVHLYVMHQLGTVYTGTVKLYLHIATTDDLAFKCRSKCYRDINICNLDLDITRFQRSSVEFAYVFLNDQTLRYTEDIFCFVGHYRESQSDSACATCNDYVIQRSECVNKSRYTFECIFHQRCCISKLQIQHG